MDMQVSVTPVPSGIPAQNSSDEQKKTPSTPLNSPLDLSFRCIMAPTDILDEIALQPGQKVNCKAVRLNNNSLSSFEAFEETLSQVVRHPLEVSWFDLSFNMLQNIDKVIAKFRNIKVLYLHGNSIESLEEINKLAALPNLITLTLHGNPIESESGYRQYVLSRLPGLKNLDFSGVTKQDRSIAETWFKMHGPKRGRKNKRS